MKPGPVDVLKEIRRAMRALRRAERWIVAEERRADREARKRMQRDQDRRDVEQLHGEIK